jgi:hypothetical protein
MILEMYAIKDELNGFTTPIPFNNTEMAKRYLKDQTFENPTIKNSPEDFSIWLVGSYDTETGFFAAKKQIELIERSKNYASTK